METNNKGSRTAEWRMTNLTPTVGKREEQPHPYSRETRGTTSPLHKENERNNLTPTQGKREEEPHPYTRKTRGRTSPLHKENERKNLTPTQGKREEEQAHRALVRAKSFQNTCNLFHVMENK